MPNIDAKILQVLAYHCFTNDIYIITEAWLCNWPTCCINSSFFPPAVSYSFCPTLTEAERDKSVSEKIHPHTPAEALPPLPLPYQNKQRNKETFSHWYWFYLFCPLWDGLYLPSAPYEKSSPGTVCSWSLSFKFVKSDYCGLLDLPVVAPRSHHLQVSP